MNIMSIKKLPVQKSQVNRLQEKTYSAGSTMEVAKENDDGDRDGGNGRLKSQSTTRDSNRKSRLKHKDRLKRKAGARGKNRMGVSKKATADIRPLLTREANARAV